MRVIAGTARSMPLKTIEGMQTRPTTDKIKETLFNMLSFDIPSARFLDLFAGSGQIGIEALSRGAEYAMFVEQNKKCIACIEDNLKFTKMFEKSDILKGDVFACIPRLRSYGKFDIIFADPPYAMERENDLLNGIYENDILAEGGLIVIEASVSRDLSFVDDTGFTVTKDKLYKNNRHIFLEKK